MHCGPSMLSSADVFNDNYHTLRSFLSQQVLSHLRDFRHVIDCSNLMDK